MVPFSLRGREDLQMIWFASSMDGVANSAVRFEHPPFLSIRKPSPALIDCIYDREGTDVFGNEARVPQRGARHFGGLKGPLYSSFQSSYSIDLLIARPDQLFFISLGLIAGKDRSIATPRTFWGVKVDRIETL